MSSWIVEPKKVEEQDFTIDDFYPKIGLKKFIEEYRPPSELSLKSVVNHLEIALISVVHQLRFWRNKQTAISLLDVSSEALNGVPTLQKLFERAVYCEAKADLIKETLSADRRKNANNNLNESDELEDKYREFASDAISLIVGEQRVYVGSI